ncbi:MAG TPA: hypothetical protein VIS99_06030 [Terrimicrobiaceae bacterium]
MSIFEIILQAVDVWCSWRFYLCAVVFVGIAIFLHNRFGDQTWVWFISVPCAIIGIGGGLYWQIKANRE